MRRYLPLDAAEITDTVIKRMKQAWSVMGMLIDPLTGQCITSKKCEASRICLVQGGGRFR